ncbi:MAG: hypothetical protein ACK4UN_10865 [Limisphaerales bacterium]
MVTRIKRAKQMGMLTTDLVVAMGLLALAMIPISFSFLKEQQLCVAYYQRAVISEILDGEMEVLAAGEWRTLREGEQLYPIATAATRGLPPGEFRAIRTGQKVKLEWHSAKAGKHKLAREAVGK